MEGQGELVSRLIVGLAGVTIWLIGVVNLLTKSPDPPSSLQANGISRYILELEGVRLNVEILSNMSHSLNSE